MFEALADAGLRTAAVNFTAYRGRTRHRATVPFLGTVVGPERFFFYNLFSSDRTGAPLSWRNRAAGSVDAYAAAVGRWLVTRDAFDFLLFYLSDYDYASHAHGPDTALEALRTLRRRDRRAGRGGRRRRRAAGAVRGHRDVRPRADARARGRSRSPRSTPASTACCRSASNRAAHVYLRPGCRLDAREVAARLDGVPAAEVVAVPRRAGGGRAARGRGAPVRARARRRLRARGRRLDPRPPGRARRAWAALGNPNAGEVLVSAAAGYEFTDLGGGHHVGGGSHGSLAPATPRCRSSPSASRAPPRSIVDVAPLVLVALRRRRPRLCPRACRRLTLAAQPLPSPT